MGTTRMMPTIPLNPAGQGWAGSPENRSNRRYYAAVAGGMIDAVDVDATTLNSQQFVAIGDSSGTTAQRPSTSSLRLGWIHIDTTIPAVVAWDGHDWRNVISGATA
jgi:hypothetical protein